MCFAIREGTLALLLTLSVAHPNQGVAQGMPGGMGQMGGGMPGGMRPPRAMKPVAIEDLIKPDPLHIWHGRLQTIKATLSLDRQQLELFDKLLLDLRLVVGLNEKQVWRVVGRKNAVISAIPDLKRDLQHAQEDANDNAMAWSDLIKAYRQLIEKLDNTQRALLDSAYAQSLTESYLPRTADPRQMNNPLPGQR